MTIGTLSNESFNSELYGMDGPILCSAPSLRGHIVNQHLVPITLRMIGLPNFDLSVAQQREFDMDWVVGKTLDRMAEPSRFMDDLTHHGDAWWYQRQLGKMLHLIEDYGLSTIPWDQANEIFPGASELVIYRHDMWERPFQPPYNA